MSRAEALERELGHMREQFEEHGRRMHALLCEGCATTEPCGSGCEHRRRLAVLLRETVAELELTRRSFKSKQIEQLRRRLQEALAELALSGE